MWRSLVLLASLACCSAPVPRSLVVAPSQEQPARADAPSEPIALSGFVLLRPDATLRAGPHPEAEQSELFPPSPDLHTDALRGSTVMRVVARDGEYFGVRTGDVDVVERVETGAIAVRDAACHRAPEAIFSGLDLVVWVHRDDLQPVLVDDVEAEFDGGRVALFPGVPVGPASRTTPQYRTLAAKSLTITMPVPDDAIGLVYTPSAQPKEPASMHHLPRRCDGKPCAIDVDRNVRVEVDDVTTVNVLEGGEYRSTVEVHTRCAIVEGTVPNGSIVQGPRPGGGGGSACGGYSIGRDFVAVRGATVYFADGTRAGVVAGDWVRFDPRHRVGDDARVCFRRHPTDGDCGPKGRYLTLCFDRGDVLEPTQPQPRT